MWAFERLEAGRFSRAVAADWRRERGEILPRTFMVGWRAGLNGAKGGGDANGGEEFGGASCRFLQ